MGKEFSVLHQRSRRWFSTLKISHGFPVAAIPTCRSRCCHRSGSLQLRLPSLARRPTANGKVTSFGAQIRTFRLNGGTESQAFKAALSRFTTTPYRLSRKRGLLANRRAARRAGPQTLFSYYRPQVQAGRLLDEISRPNCSSSIMPSFRSALRRAIA